MRAFLAVVLVCHLSTLLSQLKLNLGGYSVAEFYASQRASSKANQADVFYRASRTRRKPRVGCVVDGFCQLRAVLVAGVSLILVAYDPPR
jgi:hypothetical protein